MMPLTLANAGEENTILKVGGSAEVKKHLDDLGFVAGGTVSLDSSEVVSKVTYFRNLSVTVIFIISVFLSVQ